MEDAARIEARIASLKDLGDLFSAIEAIAASRVQAAQESLTSVRRYAEVIEHAIGEAASLRTNTTRPFVFDDILPTSALVAICSEQGFTGAFNRLVLERARSELAPKDNVIIVGNRGAAIAADHELEPAFKLGMATRLEGVLAIARQLAAKLNAFDTIRVVFGKYRGGSQFEVEIRQILPPTKRLFAIETPRTKPLHQLPPAILLQRLIGELLLAELMLALTESFASENAARLQIMQGADHSICDKIEGLTQSSRQLRQEHITSELLEVVAGAEAVRAMGDGGNL